MISPFRCGFVSSALSLVNKFAGGIERLALVEPAATQVVEQPLHFGLGEPLP